MDIDVIQQRCERAFGSAMRAFRERDIPLSELVVLIGHEELSVLSRGPRIQATGLNDLKYRGITVVETLEDRRFSLAWSPP